MTKLRKRQFNQVSQVHNDRIESTVFLHSKKNKEDSDSEEKSSLEFSDNSVDTDTAAKKVMNTASSNSLINLSNVCENQTIHRTVYVSIYRIYYTFRKAIDIILKFV